MNCAHTLWRLAPRLPQMVLPKWPRDSGELSFETATDHFFPTQMATYGGVRMETHILPLPRH